MAEDLDFRTDSHAPMGVSPELAQTIDERANHCFGCGTANPEGLHLIFDVVTDADGIITATAEVNLSRMFEGPPGHIHGGIIATLLDEAMSKLNRPLNVLAMTRNLSVDYLRPSPLGTALKLVGKHVKRDGRKVFNVADLIGPDGKVLAHGEGFFLVIDPALLGAPRDDG